MICANELEKEEKIEKEIFENFLKLLAPFAPHIAEEIWENLGHKKSIFLTPWPKWDPKLVKEEMITLIIQVNGKVRDKVEVEATISEEKAKELAISREKIKKWIEGKEIKKVIFVPGKLINIVV
jgi:leucyl-tRNA synthetase